ncbi:MAG: caspase family protein [Leptolyngbyaceae cyanobacterium]
MPAIKRRHFLQSAAATLTTIGMSQFNFLQQARQFDRVVAQNAPRKYALLVGINDYGSARPLNGCLTDVQLMRNLLEHRYGFDAANIVALTNAQATREAILTQFTTHLIDQAQPGDVVVFHFSGHGWMVLDPDPNPEFVYQGKGVNGTIIPSDWNKGKTSIRSIMGHTIFLLMSALKTENVTVVLDSCHSGGGLRGNSTIRAFSSRSGDDMQTLPQEEIDYQQEWLKKLNLSEAEFKQRRKQGIAKGIGLGGATLQQEAKDAKFDGFNAGAFTYTLTRYLWQSPISQPLETMYTNLQLGVQLQSSEQLPVYETKPGSQNQQQPIFFSAAPRPAAEAVILTNSGQEFTAWLGGVSPNALVSYQAGSVLTVVDAQGKAIGEFEQTSARDGLQIKGRLKSSRSMAIAEGTLLRQKVVGVPTDLKLKLGLDPSLGDTAAALRQQLAAINWLELLPVAANQSLDYILGRMTESTLRGLKSAPSGLPPTNAISLFTADLTPVPEAFVPGNEPVSTALSKLRPRLKSLLATRLLKSILGDTSPLKVSAHIFPVDAKNQPIAAGRTIASRGMQSATLKTQAIKTQPLKLGSTIGVQLKNEESTPLYVAALVISDTGELGVLFPFGFEAPDDKSLVKPNSEFQIPVPFEVYGTPGFMELLILASKEPLRTALLSLKQIAQSRGITRGQPAGLDANETSDVVGTLLADIDQSSRGTGLRIPSAYRAFDTGKLAALSAVFQVVQ